MGPGERHGPERRAVQRSARKFSTVFLWRKRPGIEGRTVSPACFHWGLFWVQSALRARTLLDSVKKYAEIEKARPEGPPF